MIAKKYFYNGKRLTSREISFLAGIRFKTFQKRIHRFKGNVAFAINPELALHGDRYMSKMQATSYECRMLQESFLGDPEVSDNVYC